MGPAEADQLVAQLYPAILRESPTKVEFDAGRLRRSAQPETLRTTSNMAVNGNRRHPQAITQYHCRCLGPDTGQLPQSMRVSWQFAAMKLANQARAFGNGSRFLSIKGQAGE